MYFCFFRLALYPFGPNIGDDFLSKRDSKVDNVHIPTGFPVGKSLEYDVYVSYFVYLNNILNVLSVKELAFCFFAAVKSLEYDGYVSYFNYLHTTCRLCINSICFYGQVFSFIPLYGGARHYLCIFFRK